LADLDIEVARLLYSAHAIHEETYSKIVNGLDNYTRLLLNTNLPEEGEETFQWLNDIRKITHKYYPKDIYLVGESTNRSHSRNWSY
jgi:uncharacterized protein